MRFIEFITKKTFFKNLAISIGIVIVLFWFALMLSKFYTRHGQSLQTPNLIGSSIDNIKNLPGTNKLKFQVIDSVFDDSNTPGTIVAQDPLPDSKVKPGRNVYLTIVSHIPEQITLPELRDLSLRQVKSLMQTYGMEIGQIKYVPDIAENAVIDFTVDGAYVEPGTQILKSSVIDLVVGSAASTVSMTIPLLIGKSRADALNILHQKGIYAIDEQFSGTSDSANARVFEQVPQYVPNQSVNSNTNFILIYKTDTDVNFDELLEQYSE